MDKSVLDVMLKTCKSIERPPIPNRNAVIIILKDISLIFGAARQKAEIRRLTDWIDQKFQREVYRNIVQEKVHKRFATGKAPDSQVLKIGLNNLLFHMEYIELLLERRQYLAADTISMADLSDVAQLSIIDYLGVIPW